MLVIPPKEIDGKLKFRNNDVFVRDGITLTDILKSNERTMHIPVIHISAKNSIEKSCIAHVLSNLKKIKPPKSNLRWFSFTQNCILKRFTDR